MRASWVLLLVPALTVAVCASCNESLQPAVAKDLQHAHTLSGLAYAHVDAATASGAEMRGAFCAVEDALQRYNVDSGISDAGIVCKR